jgi:hypothetical protein
VIVWLNGTFGAGKTATAAALVPLIHRARLFDPETVGYMLRPNLADHPVSDFRRHPIPTPPARKHHHAQARSPSRQKRLICA